MLSYTTARATVQQVLQKHYEPKANTNIHVQNVMQRQTVRKLLFQLYEIFRIALICLY
jgi:hypothetical protein